MKNIIAKKFGVSAVCACAVIFFTGIYVNHDETPTDAKVAAHTQQQEIVNAQAAQVAQANCNPKLNNPFGIQSDCLSPSEPLIDSVMLHANDTTENEKEFYLNFVSNVIKRVRTGDVMAMNEYISHSNTCKSITNGGGNASNCVTENFSAYDLEFLEYASKASHQGNAGASLALAQWNLMQVNTLHSKSSTKAGNEQAFFASPAYAESISKVKAYLQLSDGATRQAKQIQNMLTMYEQLAEGVY